MADPTLATTSGTFITSGTSILTLYNTDTESIKKSANLIPFNMPTKDSDETIAFDLLGVTRDITVRGKFTVEDNADIWKFAEDLDNLINGNQGSVGGQVGYTYTSVSLNFGSSGSADRINTTGTNPYTGNTYASDGTKTFRVYVNDGNFDFIKGDPNMLSWSLSLIQVNPATSV